MSESEEEGKTTSATFVRQTESVDISGAANVNAGRGVINSSVHRNEQNTTYVYGDQTFVAVEMPKSAVPFLDQPGAVGILEMADQDVLDEGVINAPVYRNKRITSQVADRTENPTTEVPSFLRRIFTADSCVRRFRNAVNKISHKQSLGGIVDKYQRKDLQEPSFEVDSRMDKVNGLLHGELLQSDRNTGDYRRERMCNPSASSVDESQAISREELFKLIRSNSDDTRVIAILGMAGSGKSTMIKRLVRDIIKPIRRSSNPFKSHRFQLVRLLNIKDIARQTNLVSAQGLLFSQASLPKLGPNEIYFGYEWAKKNESEILLAIDGLDQASWNIPEGFSEIGYDQKARIEVVMANILSGHLFGKAKILLTSRHHSVASLSGGLMPKIIIELKGLKLCDAERVFDELVSHVNENGVGTFQSLSPGIIALCSIPLFLVYNAAIHVLKPNLRPKTMSAVVHEMLCIFLSSEHNGMSLSKKERDHLIASFKTLSLQAILEMRVTFDWPELRRLGLTLQMISQFTISVPGPATLRQKLFDHDIKVFFSHQILQEMFAAMAISEKKRDDFGSFSSTQLLQNHLSVVRRFTCGLLPNSSGNSEFLSINDRQEKWDLLKETLRQQAKIAKSSTERLELLALLYETQDEDLIQSLVKKIDFTDVSFTPATAHAMATILTCCRHLSLFRLKNCRLDEECVDIMERVTPNLRLKIDVAELDISLQLLLGLGRFLENLKPNILIIFLRDYSSAKKLTSWQNWQPTCPCMVFDAEVKNVCSIIAPTSHGEQLDIPPASHEEIAATLGERFEMIDVVEIISSLSHALKLRGFIEYLQPELLFIFLTDGDITANAMSSKWQLNDTCVLVFQVCSDGSCDLLGSSTFSEETVIPVGYHEKIVSALKRRISTMEVVGVRSTLKHISKLRRFIEYLQPNLLVIMLTDDNVPNNEMSPSWQLNDTFVMVLQVRNDGTCVLIPSQPFSEKTAIPDVYHEKVSSALKARMNTMDVVEIRSPMSHALQLRGFMEYLRPKILFVFLADEVVTSGATVPPWQLHDTCVIVLQVHHDGICELIHPLPFSEETIIPVDYHEKIATTLRIRINAMDAIRIRSSLLHISKLRGFIEFLQPKLLLIILTGKVPADRAKKSPWRLSDTCVMMFQIQQDGTCKLIPSTEFSKKTIVPDGYHEKITSILKAGIKTNDRLWLNRSLCERLRRNRDFIAVGLVSHCNVEEVSMTECNLRKDDLNDFMTGARGKKIKRLDLTENEELRENKGFITVGTTVKQCNIDEVMMRHCKIGESHMSDFASGAGDTKIKRLDVSWNDDLPENRGFNTVGTTVRQCDIDEVVMRGCSIEGSHMKDFASGAGDTKIKRLDVSGNDELRANRGFNTVGTTVKQCNVDEVVMQLCGIEGSLIKDFASGAGSTKIKRLDVSGNPELRATRGFNTVGTTVKQCNIDEVVMQLCGIDGSHMKDFASGAGSTKIMHLDLSKNYGLGRDGGCGIVGSTVAQCKVDEVAMRDCWLEGSHVKNFADCVGDRKIRMLDLSWNKVNGWESLGEEGLNEITRIVRRNRVEVLIMERCDFKPDQLQRFKKSIPGIEFRC